MWSWGGHRFTCLGLESVRCVHLAMLKSLVIQSDVLPGTVVRYLEEVTAVSTRLTLGKGSGPGSSEWPHTSRLKALQLLLWTPTHPLMAFRLALPATTTLWASSLPHLSPTGFVPLVEFGSCQKYFQDGRWKHGEPRASEWWGWSRPAAWSYLCYAASASFFWLGAKGKGGLIEPSL